MHAHTPQASIGGHPTARTAHGHARKPPGQDKLCICDHVCASVWFGTAWDRMESEVSHCILWPCLGTCCTVLCCPVQCWRIQADAGRCLRACVPACLRACVPACLRACVHACLRAGGRAGARAHISNAVVFQGLYARFLPSTRLCVAPASNSQHHARTTSPGTRKKWPGQRTRSGATRTFHRE